MSDNKAQVLGENDIIGVFGAYPVLERGEYILVFNNITKTVLNPRYGPVLFWNFSAYSIVPADGAGGKAIGERLGNVSHLTPALFAPGTKATEFAETVVGRDIEKGEAISPAMFANRAILAYVVIEENKQGVEQNRVSFSEPYGLVELEPAGEADEGLPF